MGKFEVMPGDLDKKAIVADIAAKWDKWDSARASRKDAWKRLQEFIELSVDSQKCCELAEKKGTFKANLWNSFKNEEAIFDVQGETSDADAYASQQKASLVNALKEAEVLKEFDAAFDYFLVKGSIILFVDWVSKYRNVRRPSVDNVGDSFFQVSSQLVYDGVRVKAVDPANFVYDIAKYDKFDQCGKIYRNWLTYQDIIDNEKYAENLSEEDRKGLKALISGDNNSDSDENNSGVKGDQIEILEYWGDYKLSNGTVLRNFVITIAGRSKIVRYEENPYIDSPFIHWCALRNSATKYEMSLLEAALPLVEKATNIQNKVIEAINLIINKPYLAPKGMLSGEIKITEGAIIEYDSSLMTSRPEPLDFTPALQGWAFVQSLYQEIENLLGLYKNMSGLPEDDARTATEIQAVISGQSVRLSMIISLIGQFVIIPLIQRIANLISNFKFEEETIRIRQKDGSIAFIPINSDIRQAHYTYIYGDSCSIAEKRAKFADVMSLFQQAAQVIPNKVNWVEVLKEGLETYDWANPDKFIYFDALERTIESITQDPVQQDVIKQGLNNYLIAHFRAFGVEVATNV